MPDEKKPKGKIGRPTKRTPELTKKFCRLISLGKSIRYACEEVNISITTWLDWIATDEGFAKQYASAKQQAIELMADDILSISDDDSEDAIYAECDDKSGKSAKRLQNSEFINRSRLRVDTRKWLMSKLVPKKYGDKMGLEHSGESKMEIVVHMDGNPENEPKG